jgi:hypothetical protein
LFKITFKKQAGTLPFIKEEARYNLKIQTLSRTDPDKNKRKTREGASNGFGWEGFSTKPPKHPHHEGSDPKQDTKQRNRTQDEL